MVKGQVVTILRNSGGEDKQTFVAAANALGECAWLPNIRRP